MATRLWQFGVEARQRHEAAFPALRWTVGPLVLATAFLIRARDLRPEQEAEPWVKLS
jgi:hypothetical protein